MSELIQYKCPCCGGAVEFNSTAQKMKCPYCDTEFEIETLKKYDEELKQEKQKEDQMQWQVGRRRDLKDEGLPLRILWW